jgi:hypothetical protein
MKERTKIWLISGLLLLFGLAFAANDWKAWPSVKGEAIVPEFLGNLLQKLGEAMAIAGVLTLVVDAAAKQRLLREFAKEVSTHIIGRRLPPELRTYIEQYLETDLIRTGWTITYTISEWPGRAEFERLVTLSVYEMENRSSSEQEYYCNYEVEKSFFPDVGKTRILHVSGANLLEPGKSFDIQNQDEMKLTEKEGSITFSKKVAIPAHAGPAYRFSAESEECFRDGSIVPFFANHPVLSTTLTVFYPTERMKVFVDLSFGDIEKDAERIPLSNGVQWIFNKPMLRGQGFSARFAKMRPDDQAAGAVASEHKE